MSACGWRVWRERQWPHQWIGQCNRTLCSGGIRCNALAEAEAFYERMQCVALRWPSVPGSPAQLPQDALEQHPRNSGSDDPETLSEAHRAPGGPS